MGMLAKGAFVLVLFGAVLFPAILRADLRIVFRNTYPATTVTHVDYYKGNLRRTHWGAGSSYTIVDSAKKQAISINPANHTYSVHTFTPKLPTPDTSRTIVVEIDSRDTGEQRLMFGHAVHHIVTTRRRHTESHGRRMADDQEMTVDGWYMDVRLPAGAESRASSVAVLYVGDDQNGLSPVPNLRVVRHGPVPRGLPVWEKTGDTLTELTEFWEAPLDTSVFEVPAGYRRVVHPFPGERLAWDDWLLFQWQQFEGWLNHLL